MISHADSAKRGNDIRKSYREKKIIKGNDFL